MLVICCLCFPNRLLCIHKKRRKNCLCLWIFFLSPWSCNDLFSLNYSAKGLYMSAKFNLPLLIFFPHSLRSYSSNKSISLHPSSPGRHVIVLRAAPYYTLSLVCLNKVNPNSHLTHEAHFNNPCVISCQFIPCHLSDWHLTHQNKCIILFKETQR